MVEEIRVALRPAGYRFLPGHRIRVSVASSAWPVVWPSPFAAEFALHHGPATPSRLVLPVIPPAGGPGDAAVPAFKTTPPDAPEVGGEGSADEPVWRITPTSSPAASRSPSTMAARTSSTTAGACTPPRR